MKKSKKRFKFQAFTSTLSCTLVLLLMGLTILSVLAARNIREYLREDFVVILTLGGGNDMLLGIDENSSAKTTEMQTALKAERYVKDLKLVSAEEVLQQQISVIGGNPEEFLGFNPYYNELEVSLKADYANSDSLGVLTKELSTKYPLVSDIRYEKDIVDNLNNNISKVTYVLLGLTTLLAIILFTLINNMVHLSIYARRFQIHTMKLVGANWWFIRRPFILRSLWIALVSGVAANAALIGIVEWLKGHDEAFANYLTFRDIICMSVSVFVMGLVLLMLCTFVSVNHFIKMKEADMYC